jgi:hypothetical protein
MTFTIKIPLIAFVKSHTTLVVNNNKLWIKEKVNKIHLHLLTSHIHIVVYNKNAIILVDMKANDVLSHVLFFNHFKCFKHNFEII